MVTSGLAVRLWTQTGSLRAAAVGAHQGVLALVLHPHQGDLADVAALVPPHGHDDDRDARVPQRVGLPAAGALVGLDLVANPAHRARNVLTFHRTAPPFRPNGIATLRQGPNGPARRAPRPPG